jgi:rod shape-determining protein MreC
MQQFFLRNKKTIFIAALLLVALTLFAKGIEQKKKYSFFDRIVLTLFAFPLSITNKSINAVSGVWHNYIYLIGLQDENSALKKRADALSIENQLLREQADENKRLRDLLVFRKKFVHKMLPAEIIGRDPSGWFKTILVDKGSIDGVLNDAGVIAPEGVVGRVIEVGLNSSKVLLLSDINSYVDALIQRTRTHGIVIGKGEQLCTLSYVLKTEDVAVDDVIVSSGINTIYPKGIIIGTVTKINKDRSGFFQSIVVKPAVDFSKLHEVLIVLREPEKQK